MHPYNGHGPFEQKFLTGDSYRTHAEHPSILDVFLPSFSFYSRLLAGPLRWLCNRAAKGLCDDVAWVYASVWVADILERMGTTIAIEGMNAINAMDGPCVFVANHMSTLETFMLPGIIRPRKKVTFVVKKSLTSMPFFGPVMRSRDPIVVGRSNPREDLTAVLEGGLERLGKNISIIVFPQHTRSRIFAPQHFNTIGVKLAKKAAVPIVPLALKTDAWGQGKKIKELGPIKTNLTVHYRFGPPLRVHGPGKVEHNTVCQFIATCLDQWKFDDTCSI
ncbi:MAG: 1-acyl-sn-glycerol-3-phosphate acyltransferase [Desulfovibrio sp.]|nr:1-acyl-sn-glycerol-3-phosphate acyltransferase [Desulfovibrio sp.]